jgi:hypothetical protein
MSDAAAYATISLAQSTQAINGRLGKGNFNVKREPMPAPLELTPGGWPGPALALTPARTQGGRQPLRRRILGMLSISAVAVRVEGEATPEQAGVTQRKRIITAPDLDVAMDWARRASVACQAPVEVRPFEEDVG